MRENTIKAHADFLKESDDVLYNKMMAELAMNGQIEYFKQTLCRSGKNYNLKQVRLIVADIMKKYLGFSDRNFRENVLPEMPKVKEVEEV